MTKGRKGVTSAAFTLAVVLAASFLGYSSLAAAGTIGISGSSLIIGAEPADGDVALVGSVSGTDFVLVTADSFDIVTPGCSGNGVITCPLSGFTALIASGSTGDDSLDFSGLTFGAILAGGEGNDTIIGAPFDDVIFGEAGDDVLIGDAGDDVLLGGPGFDVLDGDLGNNIVLQDGGSLDLVPLPRPTQSPEPGSLLLLLTAFIALPSRSSVTMTKDRKVRTAAALFLALSVPAITRADVVIDAIETGGDVVFSYSGSIDVSGLGTPQLILLLSRIQPDSGTLVWGGVSDVYSGLPVFPVFGTGTNSFPDSRAGDEFATIGTTLGLPEGYETGDPIEGSLTFETDTLASLGLTSGTYVLQLPNDTITLNIGVAQVPEPATLALLGIVLVGLGFSRSALVSGKQ